MSPTSRGSLYGIPGRPAPGVDVTAAADAFLARSDGADVRFGFADSRRTRGGDAGDLLVVETTGADPRLTLYVPLDWAIAALPAEAPAAVREELKRLAAEERRAGRNGILLFLAAMMGCLLIGWGCWRALDVALVRAVDLIPTSWEVTLGQAASLPVTTGARIVTEGKIVEPVQAIVDRLLSGVSASPYPFTVTVVKNGDVNAFALPGGKIVVLTGLLDEADDAAQVAGVLAHEIQHVLLRHGLKSMMQSLKWSLALSVLVGDAAGIEEVLLVSAGDFAKLSHGRDAEREADREGMRLLHRTGLDPDGVGRFFEKMEKATGTQMLEALSFLTTHPGHGERFENARKLKTELGPAAARPLPLDWPGLKAALKGL